MPDGGFEKLKALIVEDNAHMRSLLRALLNSVGIRDIAEAAHGGAALQLLLRHQQPRLQLQQCLAARRRAGRALQPVSP